MVVGSDQILVGKMRLDVDGFLKIAELPGGEDYEEGLKQNYGLPEAGIEVVMAQIHFVPSALGIRAQPTGKVIGAIPKVAVQILHHFLQRADLVKELKPVGKQDAVEEPAHSRGTLSS